MVTLDDFVRIGTREHGLCVVITLRADQTMQASVVNAGVLRHPITDDQVVGVVAAGRSRKLANVRARPRATVVMRSGGEWVAAEGAVELAGPDDPLPGLDGEGVRMLLRDVFSSAGGTHEDWETYDRVMAEERRTVVLVRPDRVYSNG